MEGGLIGPHRGWAALAIACIGLGAAAPARAADADAHAALAGVNAVAVRAFTHGKWPRAWPNAAHLEAKVRLRLRETGVPVTDQVRKRSDAGTARLSVRIDVMRRAARDTIANVPFRCEVSVERGAEPGAAATTARGSGAKRRITVWSAHDVAFEAKEGGPEELFETLDEEVDAFASDWLSAHPRK